MNLRSSKVGILKKKSCSGGRRTFESDNGTLLFIYVVSKIRNIDRTPPSDSKFKDWIFPQNEKKSVTCFSVTVYQLSVHRFRITIVSKIGSNNSGHNDCF